MCGCSLSKKQLRKRPHTTGDINFKSKAPNAVTETKYHANCAEVDGTRADAKPVATTSSGEKPHTDVVRVNSQADWMQWHQIMATHGMVGAANAISDAFCSQCDKLTRADRRSNRIGLDSELINANCYNGHAMDVFSSKMKLVMKEQFGRWPRVYERMPEMRVMKFNGTIENLEECAN